MGREQQTSLYQELSEAALRRHFRIKSRLVHGERKPYYLDNAIADVIKRSRRSPTQIFLDLVRQTTVTPTEANDAFGMRECTSWEEFFRETSGSLLARRMLDEHPEIGTEDDRRFEYWEARRKN